MNLTEKEIYHLIKQAVAETFDEKLLQLKLALIPEVDSEENRELEAMFPNPEQYLNEEISIVEDSIQ
jgi:hypothetical protein